MLSMFYYTQNSKIDQDFPMIEINFYSLDYVDT